VIPARSVEKAANAPAIPRRHPIQNRQRHRRPFVRETLIRHRPIPQPSRQGAGLTVVQGRMIPKHERLPDPFQTLANRRTARWETPSGEARLTRRDPEQAPADGRDHQNVRSRCDSINHRQNRPVLSPVGLSEPGCPQPGLGPHTPLDPEANRLEDKAAQRSHAPDLQTPTGGTKKRPIALRPHADQSEEGRVRPPDPITFIIQIVQREVNRTAHARMVETGRFSGRGRRSVGSAWPTWAVERRSNAYIRHGGRGLHRVRRRVVISPLKKCGTG
jgi:hypothetical protein